MYNYAGNAARDDLDWLSEPLKKLVGTYPKTNEWLSKALRAPDFPVPAVDDVAKDGFVQHAHMYVIPNPGCLQWLGAVAACGQIADGSCLWGQHEQHKAGRLPLLEQM